MRKTLLIAFSLLLTGCAQIVSLEAAPDANNPDCAEISVRMPDQVGELDIRDTNAQATSAWGDPTAVILRCGIEPVFASELACVTVRDVDWLVDDSQVPNFRFISFARDPATEIIVDSENASGITSLEALSPAVSVIAAQRFCTVIGD